MLMRLSGGAYAVYQQLSEEKRSDFACIKDVLYTAFALSPVTAYKQFAARRLRPGETVDVYLAELRKLATQFGGMTERGLVCAFIAGLPEHVENLLQATNRFDDIRIIGPCPSNIEGQSHEQRIGSHSSSTTGTSGEGSHSSKEMLCVSRT